MISLERAVDCFCEGFAYGRSIRHPFECVRIGPLRVLRDGPRESGDRRVEELVVYGAEPDEAIRAVRKYGPRKFFVSVLLGPGEDEKGAKEAYKSQGMRLLRREPMFVKSLDLIESFHSPLPVTRVRGFEAVNRLNEAAGSRQCHPEDVEREDARMRLYGAYDGEQIVGWVKSVRTDSQCCWVSNMYVLENYRRRGIARALMTTMLEDDAVYGASYSVLLSSAAGSRLYPVVGYEQVGLLLIFAPNKDIWNLR